MTLVNRRIVLHIIKRVSSISTQNEWNEKNLTNDWIVTSPYRKVTVPRVTLSKLFWERIEKWPDEVAVECSVSGKRYTYAALRENSQKFANSLLASGFQENDTVAVMLFNVIEYPIVIMGALEAGLILTTLHPQSTKEETQRQLKNSRASGFITHPTFLNRLDSKLRCSLKIICIPETTNDNYPQNFVPFAKMTKESGTNAHLNCLPERDPTRTSLLVYSSGTTGFPKGVMINQRNLVAQTLNRSVPEINVVPEVTASSQPTVPCVPPMSTIFSLGMMTRTFFNGGKFLMVQSFHPNSFVQLLENNKDIVLHVVPSILTFLATSDNIRGKHLRNLIFTLNGGATADINDIRKLLKKKYHNFLLGYGMTEATSGLTHSPITNSNYHSTGFVISNTEAKVIHPETGEIKRTGEQGELCFRGLQIMKGYFNDPEATRETIDEDDWLHTGDMGYFDESGQCYITDRIKDLIKVKGFQVAPAELEYVIKQHPSVYETCVTSIPDVRTGELPVAFVVLKERAKTNPAKIKDFVNARVAPHKRLSCVTVIDSIPKTPSGKLKRNELKRML